MRKRIFSILTILSLLTAFVAFDPTSTHTRQTETDSSRKIQSNFIIGYNDGTMSVVGIPPGISAQAIKENYLGRHNVSYVELDQTVSLLSSTPNDAYYKVIQKKPFDTMQILDSWEINSGKSDIIIATLDTGVDDTHPDLVGRIMTNGYNFVNNNSDVSDENGHGTMIAGIIAGNVNNSIGIAGATKKCMILPVKVLDAEGNGLVSNIASGIKYAADKGARVINVSLGCQEFSQTLQDAVDYAYGKGAIVIAASGNDGGSVQYPAACTHALAVGAVTSTDVLVPYSCYGSSLALVAVGTSIMSTSWSDGSPGYAIGSGTSFAAPFVSSLAALLLSEYEKYTPDQVTSVMEKTATDLGDKGWDQYYGYGCINFKAALLDAKKNIDINSTP